MIIRFKMIIIIHDHQICNDYHNLAHTDHHDYQVHNDHYDHHDHHINHDHQVLNDCYIDHQVLNDCYIDHLVLNECYIDHHKNQVHNDHHNQVPLLHYCNNHHYQDHSEFLDKFSASCVLGKKFEICNLVIYVA